MLAIVNSTAVPAGTAIRIWLGSFWHEGIADGAFVIHNSKKHGKVVREMFHAFSEGRTAYLCDDVLETDLPMAVVRAISAIGLQYDLWTQNCQHFVRWAHGLVPESPQLQRALIAATGLAITQLSNTPVGQIAGTAATISTVFNRPGENPFEKALVWSLAGAFVAAVLR